LLFVFSLGSVKLAQLVQAPWYTYLGGALGVLIIYGVVHSIPKVGVAPATTAIILGQVLTASLIDHFGLFGMERLPFTWHRIAGTLLMAVGAWLLLKK
jgi:transporter family-2 protein